MKKGTLTKSQLKLLVKKCRKDGFYYSKKGQDYINGLALIFPIDNTNDRPFTIDEIVHEPELSDFGFDGIQEFKRVCKLYAKPMKLTEKLERIFRGNEKIVIESFYSEEWKKKYETNKGIVYLLTALVDDKEYIVKFGQTRKTLKDRIGSYNCGYVNNWRTASTTNIKILQSMLTSRLFFNLYAIDCSDEPEIFVWYGEKSSPFASSKSLAYEEICNRMFIKKYKKPTIANIQVSPDGKPVLNEDKD
jgi:hypothetical protein